MVIAASYTTKSSSQGSGAPRTFWTDQEGRFVLKGAAADESVLVRCSLDQRHLAALPRAWHENLSPQVILGLAQHGKADLGDLVIADLAPVDLRIQAADKTPGSGARIVLMTEDSSPLILHADRRGRLKIIVPHRMVLNIGVGHETGFRIGHLYRVLKGTDPVPCEIQLRPPLRIHGKVVDASDQGLPGARLHLNADWPGETQLRPEFEVKDGGPQVLLQDAAGRRVYYRFLSTLLAARPKSAKDGSFILHAPACELNYKISAGFTTPAGKYMQVGPRSPMRATRWSPWSSNSPTTRPTGSIDNPRESNPGRLAFPCRNWRRLIV